METERRNYKDIYALTSGELIDFKLQIAQIKPTDVVVDLGCGDAEVLVRAHQQYGCKGIGLEILPEALKHSHSKVVAAELEQHIQILEEDFMTFDYSVGDVYILYLNRNVLGQLSLKLENELRPGARIVTHYFDLPAWESKEYHAFKDSRDQSVDVFLYER